MSKKWTKGNRLVLYVLQMCLNSKKTDSRSFRRLWEKITGNIGNKDNVNTKKISWKSQRLKRSLHDKYGWSKAKDWW